MTIKMRPRSLFHLVIGTLVLSSAVIVTVGAESASANPDAKTLYQQQVDANRAKAIGRPRAVKTAPAAIAPAPPAQRAQGIFDVRQGPVGSDQFQVVNGWAGPVLGKAQWYVVWAGSTGDLAANPHVPGLILQTQVPSLDGTDFVETTIGTFVLPSADGPLRVVAVSDAVVSLATPSGTIVRFNVVTDSFV